MAIPSLDHEARPIHILVVDDEPLVRLFLAEDLRDAGFVVAEASNADEALIYCRSGAHIDIVFTDIQMPGSIDGLALAETLSALSSPIPVIVTSGAISPGSDAPQIPFIAKPYRTEDAKALIFSTLGVAPKACE